ncbi:MAG: DUF3089 domain-containing protein [Spirochaetales bacterium]|nr:DUF3089 domain-containing protein [Spirochaetales bacterium]
MYKNLLKKNMDYKRRILACLIVLCILFISGCTHINASIESEPLPTVSIDSIYAEESNWAYLGMGEDKKADLFLVCPTVDMGKSGNYNMALDDENTKAKFLGALNMERGIYENDTRLYAPYYRQVTFPTYFLDAEVSKEYYEIAYADVRDAFLYYMEHYNNDRPLVLAGFSQGSDMVLRLMKDSSVSSLLSDKLVAAYCIGWRITEEDLETYPELKMAEGENDIGVIVSFNTEAVGVEESIVLPKGTYTYGINPLNWKTDSTVADKSLNLGACFTDYSGDIKEETPGLTGAYLDPERGSLIAVDILPSDYSNSLFPEGVYHLYDYQFFYRNLQENVHKRVESFCGK